MRFPGRSTGRSKPEIAKALKEQQVENFFPVVDKDGKVVGPIN
jgi:hypothetical protein